MNADGPVSATRAFVLIVRLGARRWLSRLRLRVAFGKRAAKDEASRTGTARKAPASPLLLGFLALSFAWGGWVQSAPVVRTTALSGTDAVVVDRWARRTAESFAEYRAPDALQQERAVGQIVDILRRAGDARSDAELRAAASTMLDDARAGRLNRYVVESPIGVGPISDVLPADLWNSRSGRNLRFAILLAFVFVASSTLSFAAVDLAKPEWDLEWLWTTPAPARAILWARFAEYALLSPQAWFVAGPLLCAALSLRLGPLGVIGGATLAILSFATLSAAIRLAAEFGLRGRLRLAKNLQALCSVLGIGSLLAVMIAGRMRPLAGWYEAAASFADPLSKAIAAPLLMLDGPRAGIVGVAATILLSVAAAVGAVAAAARFAASGLVADATGREGSRGAAVDAELGRPSLLRGVVGKDVRLLLRDRNVLVQVVLVPIFVFGMQMLLNRGMTAAVFDDPRHAAAAAFGVGAYMLMFCATGVLSGEAGSLWLLAATPHRLDDILRRKTVLWAGLGATYTAAILLFVASVGRVGWAILPHGLVAVAAIALCAYLAAAVGSLGADPTNPEPTRRVTPWAMYAYMLLSSLAAFAVYAPSWWERLSTFFFLSLLAVALWQKLRDRIPYLLDPTEAPPARLSLVDGMVAAFAFLVLTGVFAALYMTKGEFDAVGLLAAYVTAGVIVVAGAVIYLRSGVRDWTTVVGLARAPRPPGGGGASVRLGFVAGAATALFGIAYLRLLEAFPALADAFQAVDPRDFRPSTANAVAFAALAVVAAPLLEEFVFRGLALRGLERSTRPATAVLLSATMFTLVHPLMSAPPVFALGVATALVFRRTGRLAAPILCHALYNAAIVGDKFLRA